MPDLRLLPAHGPVTGPTHARVDELVAHHDERLALCLASRRRRAADGVRRGRAACPGPGTSAGSPTSTCSTRRSPHGDDGAPRVLVAQGRVTRREDDGVLVYGTA